MRTVSHTGNPKQLQSCTGVLTHSRSMFAKCKKVFKHHHVRDRHAVTHKPPSHSCTQCDKAFMNAPTGSERACPCAQKENVLLFVLLWDLSLAQVCEHAQMHSSITAGQMQILLSHIQVLSTAQAAQAKDWLRVMQSHHCV